MTTQKAPITRNRAPRRSYVVAGRVALLLITLTFTSTSATLHAQNGRTQEIPFLAGQGARQTEHGVSLTDLAQRPRRYIGTTLTVSGTVGRILNRQAFTLRDEGLLNVDAALVTIPNDLARLSGGASSLREGSVVSVTGTVRQYDPNVLERDLGVDLDRSLWGDYQNHPLIVADLIQGERASIGPAGPALPNPEPAQPFRRPLTSAVPGVADIAGPASTAGTAGRSATIDRIVENPRAYLGQTVTISGAVSRALSRRAAVLTDLHPAFNNEILVLSARPLPNLATPTTQLFALEDNIIQITGTVTLLDLAAVEERLGLSLDPNRFREYLGHPVIVTRNVTRFVPVNRLSASPQAFAGTTIETAGWIESIVGPNAFVLHDPDRLQGSDVLVISPQPLWTMGQNETNPFMFQGTQVQVSGVVYPPGRLAQVQQQHGFDLDQRVTARAAERPIVVASSIRPQ